MQTLPTAHTASDIASTWTRASLPLGISSTTLNSLRDVYITLDAAQGGLGVVDIMPLKNALKSQDALLWQSEDDESESESDEEEVSACECSHQAGVEHAPPTSPQHAQNTKGHKPCWIDFYGLVCWWTQHVGEDAETASRADSPTTSPLTVHGKAMDDASVEAPLTQTGKHASRAWQPLRALSSHAVNRSLPHMQTKRLSVPSLRSASPSLLRGPVPQRSASPTLPTDTDSLRSPLSPIVFSPLYGVASLTPRAHQVAPSSPASPASPTSRRHRTQASSPSAEPSRSYLTVSTCASTTVASAASRRTFGRREGTLWKATARAHAVLNTFIATTTTTTRAPCCSSSPFSPFRSAAAGTPVKLADAEVALLERAFRGFERDEDDCVCVAELARILTLLVRIADNEDSTAPDRSATGEDAAMKGEEEVIDTKTCCAAQTMVAVACGFVAETSRTCSSGATPTIFTRAQFVHSFLSGSGAFPPALLPVLLRRVQLRDALSATTATLATTSSYEEMMAGTLPHSTSPFELSMLVELLVRWCAERRQQHAMRRAQHRSNKSREVDDFDTSSSSSDEEDADRVSLGELLTRLSHDCFATFLDASVPADCRACDALMAWVAELAAGSEMSISPTKPSGSSLCVRDCSLLDLTNALTNVSMLPTCASPQVHLAPTRARVQHALDLLAALKLPLAMLHRLVELIVALDLHRPHDLEPLDEKAGDIANDVEMRTSQCNPMRLSATTVPQLERLRCLRRHIPRVLGYVSGVSEADPVQYTTITTTPSVKINAAVPSYLETSAVFARLTALAQAIVATAAPRLTSFRRQDNDATEVIEMSLGVFFQRLVNLSLYVPRIVPGSAAVCAERALRSSICALGFAGARDLGAALLSAARFDASLSSRRPSAHVGLPFFSPDAWCGLSQEEENEKDEKETMGVSRNKTAAQMLLTTLLQLVAHHRADWSAAQCIDFLRAVFLPVMHTTAEEVCARDTLSISTEASAFTQTGRLIEAGVLLHTWLSALPTVRFPGAGSARSASSPHYPLCEEVAVVSPFSDVSSLYLSLRQMTAEAPRDDPTTEHTQDYLPQTRHTRHTHAMTQMSTPPRAVQPIPFTRLYDFLVDAPRLFDVLRCIGWQDEINADFLFLQHTLKGISLTAEGIFINLTKVHRTLAPRRSAAPVSSSAVRDRQRPSAHRRSTKAPRRRCSPVEMALWPLPTPQCETVPFEGDRTDAEQLCTPPPSSSSSSWFAQPLMDILLCGKAYRLAHSVADSLSATHLFHIVRLHTASRVPLRPSPVDARFGATLSLRETSASFDAVQTRLRTFCRHGDSCWLHARTSADADSDDWWCELMRCLFESYTRSDKSVTCAERRLSVHEWAHALLDLEVRSAMTAADLSMPRLSAVMPPSQFIRSLLQHARVEVTW